MTTNELAPLFTPLAGKVIVDLSGRLPGPLATKLLGLRGAKIIKIENLKNKDPFTGSLLPKEDQSFQSWYEKLNNNKEILFFDFEDTSDQEKIREIISHADGLISALSPRLKEVLKIDQIKTKDAFCILEIKSSKTQMGLHDLNALAQSGLLKNHSLDIKNEIVHPPFIPVAGISFAQTMSLDLGLGLLYSQIQKKKILLTSYLDESIAETFSFLENHAQSKFLHNGLYPCYNIYRTKDQKLVALAAVEEKYWKNTLMALNLDSSLHQFETQGESVFKALVKAFGSLNLDELMELNSKHYFCITPVK